MASRRDLPKPFKKRRYYTRADVAENGRPNCWVSFFSAVYDLAPLVAEHKKDPMAVPIIEAAGTDMTHWFDPETKDPRLYMSPSSNMCEVYCPQGRFLHIPPEFPEPGFDTRVETPWWRDQKYCIGKLSQTTMKIYISNLLSKQRVLMEVPCEETMEEIQDRYLDLHNFHVKSYTWKRLGKPLDMQKTLEGNGIVNEAEEFLKLNLDPDDHIITLHLYFNDDLTEA